jgi:hypothetical protein
MKDGDTSCCPEFDPKKWDNKKVAWKSKLFLKDKVFSFFHFPLNLKSVIEGNIEKMKNANAMPKDAMALLDDKSIFYSNIYISTKKALPKSEDVKVTATFLTKVFEGSKSKKQCVKEMKEYIILEKQELKNMYFYYPICPNCSKKYGKEYTVLFAEI